MISLILELFLKFSLILLVGILLQKFGVFKIIGKGLNFLNTETKKKYQNNEKLIKLKLAIKRNIRKCDEL